MTVRTLGSAVFCGCLIATASLGAHHSLAGVYDMNGEKELIGTIVKILYVNPHGSMTISVKNPDGTTTNWVCTTGSATRLADRGLGKGTLKAGDTVTAKILPARTGNPLGYLKTVITGDGKVYELQGGTQND